MPTIDDCLECMEIFGRPICEDFRLECVWKDVPKSKNQSSLLKAKKNEV